MKHVVLAALLLSGVPALAQQYDAYGKPTLERRPDTYQAQPWLLTPQLRYPSVAEQLGNSPVDRWNPPSVADQINRHRYEQEQEGALNAAEKQADLR